MNHLKELEEESIYIIREALQASNHPVLLYSVGKDSSVLLHLMKKAVYPMVMDIPLLHVDTTWKFKEMIRFRDELVQKEGLKLIVYTNYEAIKAGINPFSSGSMYTDYMKTKALKDSLIKWKFDYVFCGARRDEEKSRAKEHIMSVRDEMQTWNPQKQRPEYWNIYNTLLREKESMRIFPLSNWTEISIWEYIQQEKISVVPLYFAKRRPVVFRNNMLIMPDDSRFQIGKTECVEYRKVRFRSLGCYPLTGAIESNASTVKEIIEELGTVFYSERNNRVIDYENSFSMERRKREGYF